MDTLIVFNSESKSLNASKEIPIFKGDTAENIIFIVPKEFITSKAYNTWVKYVLPNEDVYKMALDTPVEYDDDHYKYTFSIANITDFSGIVALNLWFVADANRLSSKEIKINIRPVKPYYTTAETATDKSSATISDIAYEDGKLHLVTSNGIQLGNGVDLEDLGMEVTVVD